MARTNGDIDPREREGRRNRRVTLFGVLLTGLFGITGALIGAVATAHNGTVIEVFGGKPAPTKTIKVTVPAAPSHGSSSNNISGFEAQRLPSGPAFTKGSFNITSSGIDFDRNPPESASLPNTSEDITVSNPTSVYFYGSQEAVHWTQASVPTQAQCHHAEVSDGQVDLIYDLSTDQQTNGVARFCILTSEGRDAYLLIPGKTIVADGPFPALVFVWPNELPLN